jgi:hypothetical protein
VATHARHPVRPPPRPAAWASLTAPAAPPASSAAASSNGRHRRALLLADELTGNLDSAHGAEVVRILRKLNAEGTTLGMLSHSLEYAAQASRTLRLLKGGWRWIWCRRDALGMKEAAASRPTHLDGGSPKIIGA